MELEGFRNLILNGPKRCNLNALKQTAIGATYAKPSSTTQTLHSTCLKPVRHGGLNKARTIYLLTTNNAMQPPNTPRKRPNADYGQTPNQKPLGIGVPDKPASPLKA